MYRAGLTSHAGPDALAPSPDPVQCHVCVHIGAAQENVLVTQGAITHAGVLRKKKEDHGRFEDPYKTVCLANLDDGVLSLRLTHNGEVAHVGHLVIPPHDNTRHLIMPPHHNPQWRGSTCVAHLACSAHHSACFRGPL